VDRVGRSISQRTGGPLRSGDGGCYKQPGSGLSDCGPIFLVGCPRSGTTLLRDLFRSHEEVAFPPRETHYLPLLYEAYGDPSTATQARRLVRNIETNWRYRTWLGSGYAARIPDSQRYSFGGLVDWMMSDWARSNGAGRWGDKTPGYALQIPLLSRIFPGARFINIVRDPHDVVGSLMEQGFGSPYPGWCAVTWTRHVDAADAAAGSLPRGTVTTLRYEDLVRDPGGTLEWVCAEVGLPFSELMLTVSRPTASTGEETDRFGGEVSARATEERRRRRSPEIEAAVSSLSATAARRHDYGVDSPLAGAPSFRGRRSMRDHVRRARAIYGGDDGTERLRTDLRLNLLGALRNHSPRLHRMLMK
jgi:Sulfotransferase family